jgi:hypothetical protein
VAGGGNGTPDNPNPINGYTEANITRCGVNLWDEETRNGHYNNSGEFFELASSISNKNPIKVNPSTTYYCHCGSAFQFFVFTYDKNGDFISRITTAKNATFTTPANCAYINWCNGYGEGGTYANNVSINSDSTDTTYHAYNGNTYPIAFGQTVYGGVLDVTRGKLHVTHGKQTYNGSENWQLNDTFGVWITKPVECKSLYLCDSYEIITPGPGAELGDNQMRLNMIETNILIKDPNAMTVETFKAKLALTPIDVCFELATPFDIDLTPVQIEALLGINNFYADTGDVIVTFVNDGQDETQTGTIVSFDLDESDLNKGDLANRLVSGNYANIRLKTGSNAIKFIGSVSAVGLDKYSRWL